MTMLRNWCDLLKFKFAPAEHQLEVPVKLRFSDSILKGCTQTVPGHNYYVDAHNSTCVIGAAIVGLAGSTDFAVVYPFRAKHGELAHDVITSACGVSRDVVSEAECLYERDGWTRENVAAHLKAKGY